MKKLFVLSIISIFTFALIAQEQETEVELDISLISSENWFSNLEEAKANPDKVFYLDLSLQKLKTFPKEILTFKNLKRLHVPNNYWTTIPDEISTLIQLEIMDISSNYYMKKLPTEALSKLKNLKQIVIKDHALAAGEIDKLKKALPNCKIEADRFH